MGRVLPIEDIEYKPGMTIKTQKFADFLVEYIIANQEVRGNEDIDKRAPKLGQEDKTKKDL